MNLRVAIARGVNFKCYSRCIAKEETIAKLENGGKHERMRRRRMGMKVPIKHQKTNTTFVSDIIV